MDGKPKIEPFGKKSKEKKEEEKSVLGVWTRPETIFNLKPPAEMSEEPKERGRVRSFIEGEVLPTVRSSAEEIASMVLNREIAPSEAPSFFAESLKFNVKERGREEVERLVNDLIFSKINKTLPFDVVYSSQEMMPSGPRSADMTVTEKVGPEWMERARKLRMIK